MEDVATVLEGGSSSGASSYRARGTSRNSDSMVSTVRKLLKNKLSDTISTK